MGFNVHQKADLWMRLSVLFFLVALILLLAFLLPSANSLKSDIISLIGNKISLKTLLWISGGILIFSILRWVYFEIKSRKSF